MFAFTKAVKHKQLHPQQISTLPSKAGNGRKLCLVSDSGAKCEPTAQQMAERFQTDGWDVTFLDLAEQAKTIHDGSIKTVQLRHMFHETNWFTPMQSICVYQWLKTHTYDVVVFQHGFGAGYYCLVARDLGLAFAKTLLVTAADAPYAKWLQDSRYFPANLRTDMEIDFFERQTVARSDVLISHSQSNIAWMQTAGWGLPAPKHIAVISDTKGAALGPWLVSQHKSKRSPSKTTKKISISVCISTYNRPALLRDALQSLSAQTAKNFEVIVIEDGSTDSDVETLRRQLAPLFKKNKWTWKKQPNKGPSVGRNHAARLARGSHLLFMDDDNLALPDEIEILTTAATSGADILTSLTGLLTNDNPNSSACVHLPSRSGLNAQTLPILSLYYGACLAMNVFINPIGDTNFLIKKNVFKKLGGFSGDKNTLMEDQQLLCRALVKGYQLEVVPDPLMLYRLHSKNRSLNEADVFRSRLQALQTITDLVPPELRPFLLAAHSLYGNRGRTHPGRFPKAKAK